MGPGATTMRTTVPMMLTTVKPTIVNTVWRHLVPIQAARKYRQTWKTESGIETRRDVRTSKPKAVLMRMAFYRSVLSPPHP